MTEPHSVSDGVTVLSWRFGLRRVRCPTRQPRRRLRTHYQLRDILSDPARHAELVNLNDGSRDPITYEYAALPEAFDGELSIPGYDGITAHLTIYRHLTRHDDGPDDPGRPNGILVKGQRAIYENTLFRFEGDVHAGWFSGSSLAPTSTGSQESTTIDSVPAAHLIR